MLEERKKKVNYKKLCMLRLEFDHHIIKPKANTGLFQNPDWKKVTTVYQKSKL